MKAEPVNLQYGSVLIVDGRVYVDCRPLEDLAVYAKIDEDEYTESKLYCLVHAPKEGKPRLFEVLNKYDLCAKICNLYEDEPDKPFVTYDAYLKVHGMEDPIFLDAFESPDFTRAVKHFSDLIHKTNFIGYGVYDIVFDKNFFDENGEIIKTVELKRITIDGSNKDE